VEDSQEDRDHPFEEDRWKRCRDLANLEVRRVRAQELGAPSHEVAKLRGEKVIIGSREQEDHWIRNPIAYCTFKDSTIERSHF
jgi:hypothetical protein